MALFALTVLFATSPDKQLSVTEFRIGVASISIRER